MSTHAVTFTKSFFFTVFLFRRITNVVLPPCGSMKENKEKPFTFSIEEQSRKYSTTNSAA